MSTLSTYVALSSASWGRLGIFPKTSAPLILAMTYRLVFRIATTAEAFLFEYPASAGLLYCERAPLSSNEKWMATLIINCNCRKVLLRKCGNRFINYRFQIVQDHDMIRRGNLPDNDYGVTIR